jgi:3-(3-hydroxy-phenyl)propionate hydroxylase
LMPSVVPVGWMAIIRPDKVVMHDGPSTAAALLLKQAMQMYADETPKDGALLVSAR